MFEYNATVIKVVDGDTVDVLLDLGFDVKTQQRLRLARIDAPSIKTTEGKNTKAFVQALFDKNPNVLVKTKKTDKYGRYLAEVETIDGNLSDLLLTAKDAQTYDPNNKLG